VPSYSRTKTRSIKRGAHSHLLPISPSQHNSNLNTKGGKKKHTPYHNTTSNKQQHTAYHHIEARHTTKNDSKMVQANAENSTIFVPILASSGYHWVCDSRGCEDQSVTTSDYSYPRCPRCTCVMRCDRIT
jgi:hypothetical protein